MILLDIHSYLKVLGNSIPENVLESAIILFIVGFLLFIVQKGIRKGLKYGLKLLLADYIMIILFSTVIFRKTRSVAKFNYIPFRTYNELIDGNPAFLLPQAVMNVLVFIPMGLLLKASFQSLKWWQLLLIGCGLSLTIELLQLFLHKGYCEFDDVMHNGIGCLIGIALFHFAVEIGNRCIQRG